jgi:heptosyltransferase-2
VTPARVLIIQTAYLGDTVFTSALVQSLRARWPAAEIDLCVAPRARDVAAAIPGVANIHLYDKRGADRGISGLRRMARRLATRQYPLAVLPHRSLRTAALARMAGIPERAGFKDAPASFLYTARVATREKTFLGREADLARYFGGQAAPIRLSARPEHVEAARAALGSGQDRFVAVCLGSEWETKIWPAPRVRDLLRTLQSWGLRAVLLGGPRERDLAREVGSVAACIDTTGNSVAEALGVLSLCSLAVGGDTGLVHAARALGIPTVAIFGPTTPEVHQFGARERPVWLALPCSPCSAHGPRRCPLGHHKCLRDLDAEWVAAACREVLAA